MAKEVKYRQLKDELDVLMVRLQSDDLDVDEALALYKKSQVLIKALEDYLKAAENTVREIKAKFEKT